MILIVAIGLVGMGIYDVWQQETPTRVLANSPTGAGPRKALPETRATSRVSTRTIVARNLFDPERGAKRPEPPAPAKAPEPEQSIDGLLLLGTVIAGTERYAIMKVPPDLGPVSGKRRAGANSLARPAMPVQGSAGVRRVRVGDSLRGYRVEDIEEQKVVLKKGKAKTEVTLDYTREVVVPPAPKRTVQKERKRRGKNSRSRRNRSRQKR